MIIYNVMLPSSHVGEFYQGSFSTEELANAFVASAPSHAQKVLYVQEHIVDTETTEGW